MKFYKPKQEYLEYLHKEDKRVILSNKSIGIPLRLNELIYFLPIDGLDETDFDENNVLRKSTPAILRMADASYNYYGKCLFSNMFAILYKELVLVDYSNYSSELIILMDKKISYLKKNINRIEKAAKRIFKQKTKGYQQGYLESTIYFLKTEKLSIQN